MRRSAGVNVLSSGFVTRLFPVSHKLKVLQHLGFFISS
ncbi:hypothetical protein BOSE21B_150005 [Bosea sp. 21B]|nr:hypothetical protein BOSE21B_150005 [Bosea sp. 21B]